MASVPKNNPSPFLSIVFCGRNDNYGGDFTARLRRAVLHYARQINRVKLPAELIFVNYNPLPENTSITQLFDWPTSPYLQIKIITVDHKTHASFIDESIRKTYPVFEFLAKNIGVRRAKGKFVLSTNADILPSEKLFDFFSSKLLKKNIIYRCNRLDFKAETVADFINENEIKNRVFIAYLQGGTFVKYLPLSTDKWLDICHSYNRFRKRVYGTASQWKVSKYIPVINQVSKSELFLFDYPCNASGDFTLMDKESWMRARAYPEDTWSAAHPDSLFLMQVALGGHEVRLLDAPIYHQDHERRFDFRVKNPDIAKMYVRLLADVAKMKTHDGLYLFNDENWGLRNEELEEIIIKATG